MTAWVVYIAEIDFLTVLKAGKCQVKVPADLVPGEESLPGFQRAASLLCFHSRVGRGRGERQTDRFSLFFVL